MERFLEKFDLWGEHVDKEQEFNMEILSYLSKRKDLCLDEIYVNIKTNK